MTLYLLVKVLHIIGATVLLGTGAGIAFFMLMAHRTNDVKLIAHTAGVVVIADSLFTATAVLFQPITGGALAVITGQPLATGWIAVSLALYVFTGVLWLPVVWMQIRMRNLARIALATNTPLPAAYYSLWRVWFAFGFPAFAAVVGIIFLMVFKPEF
jgi:uncharacterized membrane protein